MKLISVVIPIYNVEKYLVRCIESIINQTYTKLEIILVNDGSNDNCGSICNEYAEKDNRIIVIHKENGGLSDARNAGLKIATGEYICFIDSDDYIHEKMIDTLYNLIIDNNAQISVCSFRKVYDSFLNYAKEKKDKNIIINKLNNVEALNNLFNELYLTTVVAWNKLYNKELFENIEYPKNKYHEDEYTTYQLIYKAQKIVYTNQVLYYYLQRNNSITGDAGTFSLRRLEALDAFHERTVFFYNKGLYDLCSESAYRYLACILKYYYRIDKNVRNNGIILNKLKDRYRKEYKKFRKIMKISWKKRLLLYIININFIFLKLIYYAKKIIKKNE